MTRPDFWLVKVVNACPFYGTLGEAVHAARVWWREGKDTPVEVFDGDRKSLLQVIDGEKKV